MKSGMNEGETLVATRNAKNQQDDSECSDQHQSCLSNDLPAPPKHRRPIVRLAERVTSVWRKKRQSKESNKGNNNGETMMEYDFVVQSEDTPVVEDFYKRQVTNADFEKMKKGKDVGIRCRK